MANDNPFKDIKQDDLLSDDGVFQPLIDNKLEMIALNPIVSSVDDETLTQTITTAEDFVGLVEDENYLQHSQATSFNKYYSKKMQSTRELFKFLGRRLKEDLDSKKKNLKTNGIDFDQHLAMIERIPSDVREAISKRYPSAASYFADSKNGNKYQVSFLSDTTNPTQFLGALIFAPFDITLDAGEAFASTESSLARLFLSPSDFPTSSPLNSKFFNFLDYMRDFEMISKLGKEDLTRAENKMNCGFSTQQEMFNPLLDYLFFSNRYHHPNQITESTDAVENSKKRATTPVNKSSFNTLVTNGPTQMTRALAEATNEELFDSSLIEKPSMSLSATVESLDPAMLQRVWNDAFLDPLLNRICPATLPVRLLECLLPGTCRELIKYIGIWRTRDILENFVTLDLFDDKNELEQVLTKWDALVESKYSFKAVQFNGNGLLKTGTLDSAKVYPNGMNDVSVSFQVRVKPENADVNAEKTKAIFMQQDSFEIRRTPSGKIQVVLHSPEGRVSRYTSKSDAFLGNNWRSIGFSWAGSVGNFTLYADGAEVESSLTSGEVFTGPLAAPTSSGFVVASESDTKSRKGFAGQIDEIAIFDQVLDASQWRDISKIDSDINLNTLGLAPFAKAWWRMGDSSKDLISTASDTGKIIDLVGGKDFTAVGPENSAKIIVARLVKEKDEDTFIDIINRETDIEKVCSQMVDYVMGDIEVAFDPDRIKRDLLRQIRIPNFSKDPHEQIELIIKSTIVEQLLKMVAMFLTQMLEQLLDCDGWRAMTKALVKGTVNLDANTALAGLTENNPIAEFVNATQDPEQWASILAGTEDYFLKGVTTSLANGIQMHQQDTNGEHKYTTLGIGQVQFAEEHITDSTAFDTINDTTVSIRNWEGTNSQNVAINLVRKVSEELQPDSLLSLFASSADPTTIANTTEILNSFSDEVGMTFSQTDTQMFFGTIGSTLGLQDAIDKLRYAAELVNQNAADPEFCVPSQNLQDRLGIPKSDFQKALDKAAVQDILDKTDELNSLDQNDQCGIPIPMSQSEAESLKRTINDVFSPILSAYDSDLILYKLGLASTKKKNRKIKKVLWKGDTEKVKPADDQGNIREEKIEIKKTVINPEFEGMLEQGFVPLKKDGTPDGSRVGGVVKINWNILDLFKEEGGFLSELRPPKSLSPTVDGDKVTDPDVEIKDLGASLGPYTDYTEDKYARIPTTKVKLGGNATEALSSNMLNFLLEDSRGDDAAAYFALRTGMSERGIKNIITKSRTTLVEPPLGSSKKIPDMKSTVTHLVPWGRSLEGDKFVTFVKTGPEPISLDPVAVPFNLSSDTREALDAVGYDAGAPDCDALSAAANEGTGRNPDEKYIPQEYAFADVVNALGNTNRISSDQLKTGVYNSLYREVMTSILYFVADSPLLKPVPGITDADGEAMLAINFLNLETTPRLIDMDSFSSQVAEDYSTISACPDGLTEPPLYTALKTAAPRILARIYTVDLTLRAIVPFSQLFFSEKDPIIKGLILNRIEQDINLFAGDATALKAKVVQQYNALADTGLIDSPSVEDEDFETTGFKTAMGYFIEEEFNFVADRLKETVHGKCIPQDENKKDNVKKEMYQAVMRYADLGDKDIKIETYAITKETATEESKKITNFSLESQLDDLEAIGTSLSYDYNGKEILLAKVEQNAQELVDELGLDFDNIDCGNSSIYDTDGFTTEAETHHHAYSIDADGNGVTTTIYGDAPDHTHAIHNYAIVPRFNSEGEVAHVHNLVPRGDQTTIDRASVMQQVTAAMREKLTKTDSFKIVFDFSFDLNDVSSLIMLYCLQSSDDQIMSRVFNSTKKQTITMFDWLWEENQSLDPCATKEAQALALSFEDMFPDMGSAFLNPELLLMLLIAPLTTYKGWSKTADPHVFITSTIVELLGLPILPKNTKRNMPNTNPLDPNFGNLECVNWPDFNQASSPLDALFTGAENLYSPLGPYDIPTPPGPVPAPVIDGLVAAGVTYAPLIVGLPPFPPTPFGMIYYFAVSPLIWLLKDLPRLLKAMEQSESGKRALASTGLNVGPITCEDQTPAETVASGEATPVEEDEGCPPIKEFQETIIDAGQPAEEC